MIFVTTYKLKPHMTQDDVKALMDVFASVGPGPGTTAHYVNADGGGGVVISENDDVAATYRNLLNFAPWIEFDSKAMLDIDDAVTQLADFLG